jgi:hypothetical protein
MNMKHVRMVALIAMGMAVSGCASLDVASRNAPFEAPSAAATTPAMKVEAYEVRVPKSLKVSEANLYYPSGDIVWRGEPLGDRHAQVKQIFEESLARGTVGANGSVPVLIDVEVRRFHALTEKTRYTVGGRHEIKFVMNFLNPETRQPVAEPREIDATFKGFGGQRAIAAERNGVTQRKRIHERLTSLFQHELGITAASTAVPSTQDVVSQNVTAVPLIQGDKTSGLF